VCLRRFSDRAFRGMSSSIRARLTSEAQGYNDVYWCSVTNKPVVINSPLTRNCGCATMDVARDSRHKFLAHVYNGYAVNEMQVLAEVAKGTDDAEAEIKILRDAICEFGQQVHQAYHGAQPPDLCDVNCLKCPRGLCRSVQHVLSPKRPRGTP